MLFFFFKKKQGVSRQENGWCSSDPPIVGHAPVLKSRGMRRSAADKVPENPSDFDFENLEFSGVCVKGLKTAF